MIDQHLNKNIMTCFEWDPKKAQTNLKKHGVSFEEAFTVLLDENLVEKLDHAHSQNVQRFQLIGRSNRKRVLTVILTYRRSKNHEEEIYRIISGRLSQKKERKIYEETQTARRS